MHTSAASYLKVKINSFKEELTGLLYVVLYLSFGFISWPYLVMCVSWICWRRESRCGLTLTTVAWLSDSELPLHLSDHHVPGWCTSAFEANTWSAWASSAPGSPSLRLLALHFAAWPARHRLPGGGLHQPLQDQERDQGAGRPGQDWQARELMIIRNIRWVYNLCSREWVTCVSLAVVKATLTLSSGNSLTNWPQWTAGYRAGYWAFVKHGLEVKAQILLALTFRLMRTVHCRKVFRENLFVLNLISKYCLEELSKKSKKKIGGR